MFQASNFTAFDDDNGAGVELGPSLLPSGRYSRLWRRSLYVVIFCLRRPTPANSQCPPPSQTSVGDSSLPPTPPSRSSSAESNSPVDVGPDHQQVNRIAQIVKEKDLKSLHKLGGVAGVCSLLGPPLSSEVGTDDNSNPTVSETITSFLYLLWHSYQRHRCIIFLLLVSAGLSFATEMMQEGPKSGWRDGVAIVVVIMLVAFPSVTTLWCQRKLKVTVLRGKARQKVAISDIVVGDRVFLQRGDEVPAYGLLIEGSGFVVDEVISPKIDCVWNPFLFSGSKVIKGEGCMLVTSVRDKTYPAEMQNLITRDSERKKLLESQIEKPISCIDCLAFSISVIVASVVLILLLSKQDGNPSDLEHMKGPSNEKKTFPKKIYPLTSSILKVNAAGSPSLSSDLIHQPEVLQELKTELDAYMNMSLAAIYESNAFDNVERIVNSFARGTADVIQRNILEDLASRLRNFKECIPQAMNTKQSSFEFISNFENLNTELNTKLSEGQGRVRELESKISETCEEEYAVEIEIQRLINRKFEILTRKNSLASQLDHSAQEVYKDYEKWKALGEELKLSTDQWLKSKEVLAHANASWGVFKESLRL